MKTEEFNAKLPDFNPKNGARTNIHFGDDKPDYRTKDEFYKVSNSRIIQNQSQIQFG